jgi:hypothetical protein
MLDADPLMRFTTFKSLIVASGKTCGSVTNASLVGGLDGTDEWLVDCNNSGRWQVWFRSNGAHDVDQCRNVNCT